MKGVCKVCACSEADACDDGCGWANRSQTLCTACEGLTEAERAEKREINRADLVMRLETLEADAAELRCRLVTLHPDVAPKKRRTKP